MEDDFEFFMIILPNFLKKLRLPGKFAKVLNGREPREVKVQEAGCRRHSWDVEVAFDADGHMYLGRGWEQFARAHDLRLGHFLVLSYDSRHAVLTVKVFDGSMFRRHYQHDNDASSGSSSDSDNTLGAEVQEEAPPQTVAEEHDVEQGVSKMSHPYDSDGSQKERSYTSEKLSEDSLSPDNSVESANLQMLSNKYVVSVQCYLTKAQKVKIDALMERIQPKFTVLVVQMKKSNIKCHTLIIQKDYALKHFPCEDTTVILQLPGKNKGWKCPFRIRPSGGSDAGRRNLFLKNFACENHVREGDICLFQPMTNVEQRRFIVRVHILACIDGTTQSAAGEGSDSYRCPKERKSHYYKSANTPAVSYASKEFSEENPSAYKSVQLHDPQMPSKDYVIAGKCHFTLAQEKKIQALVGKIRPEIPVLVAQMKKSNVDRGCGTLAIPKDYALKYFPRESTSIILQLPSKDKAWKCRFHIRPSGVSNPGRRSLYWCSFAIDNHVREGDICLFEPMAEDKHRRFVVIVHLLHQTSVQSSPGGRSDIGSNHRRTSAKMGEPATHGEEISLSGHEDHGDSDDSEGASEPLFVAPERPSLTLVQKRKVLEKVHAIESELPICVIVMKNTSVRLCKSGNRSSGPYLTLCKQYVSRYLEKQYFTGHRAKKNVISLVLQREGGSRRWHTELRLGNNRSMIVKGWTSFVRDNSLQVDDLCLFKLMRNEETLKMVVYIIRRNKCLA